MLKELIQEVIHWSESLHGIFRLPLFMTVFSIVYNSMYLFYNALH